MRIFFAKCFYIHSNKANLCGKKWCKSYRNLHFSCKRFGHFKKKQYLCGRNYYPNNNYNHNNCVIMLKDNTARIYDVFMEQYILHDILGR